MPEYDGSIVIDSHIDTSNFDKDAGKLFDKAKKVSSKFDLNINMDEFYEKVLDEKRFKNRLGNILKRSSDLGDYVKINDISSKTSGASDAFRQLELNIAKAKNEMITFSKAIKDGLNTASSKELHTWALAFENAERRLIRYSEKIKGAPLSMPDVNALYKDADAFKTAISNVENVINKFKGFSISKATETEQAKAEVLGITKEFEKLGGAINKDEAYLKVLLEELKALKLNIGNYDVNGFTDKSKQLIGAIDTVSNRMELKLLQQKSLLSLDKVFGKTDNIEKTSDSIEKASNSIRKMGNEVVKAKSKTDDFKKSFSTIGSNIKNPFSGISNLFDNVFSNISKVFSTITRRTQWILLGQTIRAVIADAKESIADLRIYNQDFDKSMQSIRDSLKNVGNAIATSFAPMLQALAPIIANLARWITELFNKITLFTTALFTNSRTAVIADTSFSGYSKSAKKAAANTKKGTKEIKEQRKALAKFDKLDVFKQGKNKTPSSGIAGATEEIPQAMKMFKTVSIPDNILDFKNKINSLFDELSNKFKVISNEFSKGFNIGFKEDNLDVIQNKLQKIGNHLNEIFTNDDVVKKFDETILSLSFNLGKIVGSMASVGVSLGKMFIGGFEKFLDDNKERIKQAIIRNFQITIDFSNLLGNLAEFIADIATVFGEDNAQKAFGNFLGIAYTLFDTTFSNIYKLAEKISETVFEPIISNSDKIKEAFSGVIEIVSNLTSGANEAIKGFGDAVTDVVDNAITPALDSLKQIWEDRFGVVLNVWNQSLKPAFEEMSKKLEPLGQKIGELFRKLSKPIVSLFSLIVNVYNKIKPFLESYVYPFIEKVASFIFGTFANVFSRVFNTASTFVSNVAEVLGNLSEVWSNIINTISSLINGDWSSALDSAAGAFRSFVKTISSLIKIIPDMFAESINFVIRSVNNFTSLINGIGIGDFKINIPRIHEIPRVPAYFGIPGFASGTVVSPNRRFLAMLGDNNSEPEVVSPVSTMKQAFMEAMVETGINNNSGNVTLQLDGTTFARLINPYTKAEQNRIGISMIEGVAY